MFDIMYVADAFLKVAKKNGFTPFNPKTSQTYASMFRLNKLVGIGEASKALGVAITTLRLCQTSYTSRDFSRALPRFPKLHST